MKKIALLALASSISFGAVAESFAHKNWSMNQADDLTRISTNGKVVHGDRFGIVFPEQSATHPLIWLTLSTTNNITELKGKSIPITYSVDGKEMVVNTKLVTSHSFVSMNIAIFTNTEADYELISALANGKELTITMPDEYSSYFDIKSDSYSLSGFTANYVKAIDMLGYERELYETEIQFNAYAASLSAEEPDLTKNFCQDTAYRSTCLIMTGYQMLVMNEQCSTSEGLDRDCFTKVAGERDKLNRFISGMTNNPSPYKNVAFNVCSDLHSYAPATPSLKNFKQLIDGIRPHFSATYDYAHMFKCMEDMYKKQVLK